MKKALIVASIGNFFRFEINDIRILQQLGYEVDCASNFNDYNNVLEDLNINKIQIPFKRSPLNKQNLDAYRKLKQIIYNEDYSIVHCHTPIGGVVARLAARKLRKQNKLKVLYTAHGFHFYKGAPLKNWILFYPIEKWLSRYTDVLITINQEDYKRAKEHLKAQTIKYIPGVGVDIEKFSSYSNNRELFRTNLGLKSEDFAILSVGEINNNKNQQVIVKALSKLNNKNIHYFIVGKGNKKDVLLNLVNELKLKDNVHFLGYRKDIAQINYSCDLFAFPSKREGLGLASIEAMATGLPIITSNVHGINDYSIDGITGLKCNCCDVDEFSKSILKFYLDMEFRKKCSENCKSEAKRFDVKIVNQIMKEIYKLVY